MDLALADHVEVADREGRREEQRDVNQQHLVPAHVVADHHGREHEHRQHHHQRVVEVGREVKERLRLDALWEGGGEQRREELPAGLDGPLGPAVLLRLEGVHLDRDFRGGDDVGNEHEPPAAKLRAVAQVQVLGQRVVLPATRVVDGDPAPDASGAVEVEEPAPTMASAVLEHEVAIEENRLDLGEQRVVLIDVTPPGLNHGHARVREVGHQAREKIGQRQEVGVEDGHELTARDLQARFERPGLVPGPIRPVKILDVHALRRPTPDGELGDAPRFVGRVVQHLDFQEIGRILDAAHGVDEPVGHVHLVVERELDGHDWQWREGRARHGLLVLVPHVEVHEVIAVPPVNCQNDQDKKVGGEGQCFDRRHTVLVLGKS